MAAHGSAHLRFSGSVLLLIPPFLLWLRLRRPQATVVLVALAALVLDVIFRPIFADSALWQASHDRLYVLVPVIAIVALTPRDRRIFFGVAALAIGLTLVRGLPALSWRSSEELEYRWLRTEVPKLPAGSRLAWISAAGRINMFVPTFLVPRGTGTPATTWIHGTLCGHADGVSACEQVERRLVLSPIARAVLPARSSRDYDRYIADKLDVSLSNVACK
jgi:hypothetical protein